MQTVRVVDVNEAVALAAQLREEGHYDWFRGQLRCWPLLPTFSRLDADRREAALEQHRRFAHWIEQTGGVRTLLPDADSVRAVAQHYGLATDLIDFTTDPRIAGFFATHAGNKPPTEQGDSCILCMNSSVARDAFEFIRNGLIARGDSEWLDRVPELIEIDVANLWRLEAQYGVFLRVPDGPFTLESDIFDSNVML